EVVSLELRRVAGAGGVGRGRGGGARWRGPPFGRSCRRCPPRSRPEPTPEPPPPLRMPNASCLSPAYRNRRDPLITVIRFVVRFRRQEKAGTVPRTPRIGCDVVMRVRDVICDDHRVRDPIPHLYSVR